MRRPLLALLGALALLVLATVPAVLPAPAAATAQPAESAGEPVVLLDVLTGEDGTPRLAPVDDVVRLGALALTEGEPLGWRTYDAPPAEPGATLDVALAVTGPGQVVVEDVAADGTPVVLADTAGDLADVLVLPVGGTGRPRWTFAAPGSYLVEATLAGATTELRIDIPEPAVLEPEPLPQPAPESAPEPEPAPPSEPPTPTTPATAPAAAQREDACAVPGLPADAVRVSDGHFDYGVQVAGGGLASRVKDDRTSPPTWRDPAAMLFEIGEPARKQVPDNPALAFLGAPGGEIWTIGQVQEDGVPWLGWNTQHESAVGRIDGGTTWRLDAVEGPGQLFVYQTGSFGSITSLLSTADGWPRSTVIPANTHAHGNWTFTRPGVYRVTTTHLARLRSGAEVSSTGTLTFRVGPCAQPAPGPVDAGKGAKAGKSKGKKAGKKAAEKGTAAEQASPPATPAPARAAADCRPVTPVDPAAPSSPAPAPARNAVSDGHFDFGSIIEGGAMRARVKDDRTQPPSWVDPASLTFVLGGPARQEVPADAAYSFLGAAGDPIWLIPQTQVSGVPWLGWNTQHESVRQQVAGAVRYRLDGVSGPGRLAVYLTDSFGGVGQQVFGNVDGFPRSFDVPLNVHAHGNWVFTAPGTYQVTITQSATLSSGRSVSDRATLTFRVGGGSGGGGGQSVGSTLPLGPLPAAAPGDCVIPATGAGDSLSLLLPLGVTLVVTGAAILGVRRRSLAHA